MTHRDWLIAALYMLAIVGVEFHYRYRSRVVFIIFAVWVWLFVWLITLG